MASASAGGDPRRGFVGRRQGTRRRRGRTTPAPGSPGLKRLVSQPRRRRVRERALGSISPLRPASQPQHHLEQPWPSGSRWPFPLRRRRPIASVAAADWHRSAPPPSLKLTSNRGRRSRRHQGFAAPVTDARRRLHRIVELAGDVGRHAVEGRRRTGPPHASVCDWREQRRAFAVQGPQGPRDAIRRRPGGASRS